MTSPTCRRCGQQFCRSIMLECCTANCTARLASVAPGRERGVRRALSTPWSPSLDAVATTLYMESCERFHVRCERACGERACGTLCQARTILHAARALSCARPVPPDARRRASRARRALRARRRRAPDRATRARSRDARPIARRAPDARPTRDARTRARPPDRDARPIAPSDARRTWA